VGTHRDAIASTLPAGLLDELRADAVHRVRPTELARVRRRMQTLSLDAPEVIAGIADGLIDTTDVASS
jgi:hypothetical protein